MTKLQKRAPPTYPVLDTSIPAIPYESLPQATHQPVPVTLISNDPSSIIHSFSPQRASRPDWSPLEDTAGRVRPEQTVLSPVSPLVDVNSVSQTTPQLPMNMQGSRPHRLTSENQTSVDLRRLDGKPYPGSTTPHHGKTVKVAKDMHDGALPPVYKRQASDTIDPAVVTQALAASAPGTHGHDCGKCGKKKADHEHGPNCTRCGKRKTSTPGGDISGRVPPTVSEGTSRGISSSVGGSSTTTTAPSGQPAQLRTCHKCGKHKRPSSLPIQQMPSQQPRLQTVQRRSAPLRNDPLTRVHQAGLSLQVAMAGTNGRPGYPEIDVIPPSASTYHPVNSPFTSHTDDSPLVGKATKSEFKLFRNSSLARSLSRRLSKRERTVSSPLPSQQFGGHGMESGEQSAGRLINMINNAIREGSPSGKEAQYSKLEIEEPVDRPKSPFSFIGGPDEEDAFEMVDLRDQEQSQDKKDKDSVKEALQTPTHDLRNSPSASFPVAIDETADRNVHRGSQQVASDETTEPGLLTVPDSDEYLQQGGGITRFKSLRGGVSRLNSLSRSTSLKRLNSLKTVHHNWYRSDMALEGASGDTVPVF